MDSANGIREGIRSRQRAETRAALEEALARCMERAGYEATGVADVTREAGVAVGTFYVHFASKEAALDALLDRLNRELAERIGPALAAAAGGAPLEDSIRRAARAFLELLSERRWLVDCYAQRLARDFTPRALTDGVNPPVLELLNGALSTYAERRGARGGWELLAHAVLGLWLRVGLRYALSGDVPLAAAVETLTHASVGAVEATVEAGRAGRR